MRLASLILGAALVYAALGGYAPDDEVRHRDVFNYVPSATGSGSR